MKQMIPGSDTENSRETKQTDTGKRHSEWTVFHGKRNRIRRLNVLKSLANSLLELC
jgi:hypothetical protein